MMLTKTCDSTLFVRGVELSVNLGWRRQERAHEQAVLLDIDIKFAAPPSACQTDTLDETVCYATLISKIREQIVNKDYRLIEHLSAEIYSIIKPDLPTDAKLQIRITKYPKITGLTGGVCFTYGDHFTS
jgi:dihydroneopterin aldolase